MAGQPAAPCSAQGVTLHSSSCCRPVCTSTSLLLTATGSMTPTNLPCMTRLAMSTTLSRCRSTCRRTWTMSLALIHLRHPLQGRCAEMYRTWPWLDGWVAGWLGGWVVRWLGESRQRELSPISLPSPPLPQILWPCGLLPDCRHSFTYCHTTRSHDFAALPLAVIAVPIHKQRTMPRSHQSCRRTCSSHC